METTTQDTKTQPASPTPESSGGNGATGRDPLIEQLMKDLGVVIDTDSKYGFPDEPPKETPKESGPDTGGVGAGKGPSPDRADHQASPGQAGDGKPGSGTDKPAAEPGPAKPELPRPTVEKVPPFEETVRTAVKTAIQEVRAAEKAAEKTETDEIKVGDSGQKTDPDAEYFEQLGDDQRRMVEMAEFAEKKFPDKYPGARRRWLDYFRAVDKYVEEHQDEEGRTFDTDDTEFTQFLEDVKPKVSDQEWGTIRDNFVLEKARTEDEEIVKKVETQETRLKAIEVAPIMQSEGTRFDEVMHRNARENPIVAAIVAEKPGHDSFTAAGQADPVIGPPIKKIADWHKTAALELLAIDTGLKKYNPEDQMHQWIANFITVQCDHYTKTGNPKSQDGRTFLPRDKFLDLYAKNPEQAKSQYWTFTPADYVTILAINGANQIKNTVEDMQKQLESAGYSRKPGQAKPQQMPEPPKGEASPRTSSRPAVGVAEPGKSPGGSLFDDSERAALGLPR